MLAEIITIGDEILIGQTVDTNSSYIASKLNKIGVQVYQITSVQDDRQHILNALEEASARSSVVLVTGGLGPTKDDITKKTFCEYLGDHMVEHTDTLEHVYHIFRTYIKMEPLDVNLQQAMVPSTAIVMKNEHGTAPGLWMEKNDTVFVSMPGVPYEMKHLLDDHVIPRIVQAFDRPFLYHKTLLTYGLGESAIAERITDFEENLSSEIKLAYLPSLGRVRLRLSSKGRDAQQTRNRVDESMKILEDILSDIAIGYEQETTIQERIAAILTAKGEMLSLAESCTGGAIAKEITSVAGASGYFSGSITPYETKQKIDILGVSANAIASHSVVSQQVAVQMAERCRDLFQSDWAIATTGNAGPSKGDSDADIGTVFIALAGKQDVVVEEFNFGKTRERVLGKATNKALEMLLKEISKN